MRSEQSGRSPAARRDVEAQTGSDESGGWKVVERRILEVILAISVKTISNYANHLLHTPVDSVFAPRVWQAPGCACETGHAR